MRYKHASAPGTENEIEATCRVAFALPRLRAPIHPLCHIVQQESNLGVVLVILVSEFIEEQALQWLQQRVACFYEPELYRQPERLAALMPQMQGLIVRNRTVVDRELLKKGCNLQVVGRLGVGLDNLDCSALAERRITTVYAPGASARSVAEFCLMLMLAQSKRLLQADVSVRSGLWERVKLTGNELYGKTVGIVGFGAVGSLLARMCKAMGCRVLISNLQPAQDYDTVSLHTLLAESDFVSLNVPLTPQTKGLIGTAELAMMRPHAFILNTARGEVVDEQALYSCLKEHRIAGAALDVRHSEPPQANDPFRQLGNVVLSPHLAGLTVEAQAAVCQTVVEDVWRVLQGMQPANPVAGLDFVEMVAGAVGRE